MAGPGTATTTEDIGEIRPTGTVENTLTVISSMTQTLAAAEAAKEEKKASASSAQLQREQGMGSFAAVAEVSEIPDHDIEVGLAKLDMRVIYVTEQTIIDTFDNWDSDYNKVFDPERSRTRYKAWMDLS